MSLEDLLRSFASASPLHIALALLFILIARSFTASKDVGSKPTRDESDSEEEDFPAPQPAGDLTKRELATFDGKDPTKPILLAAKGVIYDVTRGRDFYGAGASYNAFAGKDCSRALGKVSLDAENLSANVRDFAASERDTLNGWVAKFQDKYPVVGKVKDGDYNETSVQLIGAGPGGADSLTLGAAKALARCDVVVHDDLGASSSSVLALATKPNVEFVSVGKRGGAARSWTQKDICALLVELGKSGKTVVRLKGGCPSTFARVSEEIKALRDAGVSYAMLPGVSSALSAPLSVGIPLTDRELGRHYSVCGAHDPSSIDFSAFSRIDTCVFLMVGRTLPLVVEALQGDARKAPSTPCCVIRNGMQPDERSWFGSLCDIVDKTTGESLSPCVLIVGEVVTLA